MTINIITQAKFDKAKQCLIDNGIDFDEADIVLQALCYILVDEETEQFFYDGEIGSFSYEDARKDVVQYLSKQDDRYFTEIGYTKDVLLDDGVIDNIVVAHMDTVRTFNCSRDYSCEEACNNILLSLQ
jgi:hypothetical protein